MLLTHALLQRVEDYIHEAGVGSAGQGLTLPTTSFRVASLFDLSLMMEWQTRLYLSALQQS
jgi:hypothetical protein